jgi:hypothetical protein
MLLSDVGFGQEAYNRLGYLLDVHVFDQEYLELNSTVFLWPQNILPVFELNDEVSSQIYVWHTDSIYFAELDLFW